MSCVSTVNEGCTTQSRLLYIVFVEYRFIVCIICHLRVLFIQS